MEWLRAHSDQLVQSTWIPGVGSVTPAEAASPASAPPRRMPLAITSAMFADHRADFVVPSSNDALKQMLRDSAVEAASLKTKNKEAGDESAVSVFALDDADDFMQDVVGEPAIDADESSESNRTSKTVDPYVTRTSFIMRCFDESTGVLPRSLSVEAHPLQRQLFDAFFAQGGPLEEHGDPARIREFYAKVTELATSITWLVRHAIAGWSFDISVGKTARSEKHAVDLNRYPEADFESWTPFQKLHRVVFVRNGQDAGSFRDEILRDERDVRERPGDVSDETKERFNTPFYVRLLHELRQLRDSMVDNEESRAKDVITTERRRAKHCDERRAYPVLGPLDYHCYIEHNAAIATVSACFDPDTFALNVAVLPDDVVAIVEALRGQTGIPAATSATAIAKAIARQHHFETKLQATCALYGECFLLLIQPNGDFMIDDMQLRNGLFVLSATQSNTKKDEVSSNNSDLWTIKLVHHMLKIHDGRLTDRNFKNVLTPHHVQSERRHAGGGLRLKAADMAARIEANLVAVLVEKIFGYVRSRFDAFHQSNLLRGEWLDIARIEKPNARRERILHKMNIHKGDVQGAVAAYHARPTRKDTAIAAAASTAMVISSEDAAPSACTGVIVPSVGSKSERWNLDMDCSVIEAVLRCEAFVGEPSSGSTALMVVDSSPMVLDTGICVRPHDEDDEDEDEDTRVLREVMERAKQVIGWLSFSRRKPVAVLVSSCDAILHRISVARAFCEELQSIFRYVKPVHNNKYQEFIRRCNDAGATPETSLQIHEHALIHSTGTNRDEAAFKAACAVATTTVASPAFGKKTAIVQKMLDSPSRWTRLSSDITVDIENMDEAAALVEAYKQQILACGTTVFFDFTDRLGEYVRSLTAYRMAVAEEESTVEEPIGLVEHSPKKSDLNFVKARIDAFTSQRDAWNSTILASITASFQLCGSWCGLDTAQAYCVPSTRKTHVRVAVSSIMQMITICEVSNVLMVTSDGAIFDAFRSGESEESRTHLMAILTDPARRNMAFSPFRDGDSGFGLIAFASASPENWKTVCCLVVTALKAMLFSRNKPFDSSIVAIERRECTVLLRDDVSFVHVYEDHREAAKAKVDEIKERVGESYPSRFTWKFSDPNIATAQHISVLCMAVPSLLNQETGFINWSGVKERPDTKNGVSKIAATKFMESRDRLFFNMVFFDDKFGVVTHAPGQRVELEGSSSSSGGRDAVHTPDLEWPQAATVDAAAASSKRARLA